MGELLETKPVATKAGTIRVADYGDDPRRRDPPFVFVHGYPDNLQIWSRVVTGIAPHRRAIAMDWPGLGQSDPVTSGATPFHLGRMFIDALDALELDRVIPVGFDMGAHAVSAAVHASPERCERLVLSNFLALGDVATSWDISIMRRLGLNQLLLGRAPRLVFQRAKQTFLGRGHRLTGDVSDDLWSAFSQEPVRRHLIKMCAGYQASLPRVARLYPDIEALTLVLWADRDNHFPIEQAQQLTERLPNASLEILAGRHHWFMWESPDDVVDRLLDFARMDLGE